MRIKSLGFAVIFIAMSFCALSITNAQQSTKLQNISNDKDILEIKQVWENSLSYFANRDIDSIMGTISPKYSRSIDGTAIDYAGFRKIAEVNDTEFFSNHLSCSVNNIEILKSSIAGDKAVVEFGYQFYAFDKQSMQWVTYNMIQKVTFAKENSHWKIISNGDKKMLR